MDYLEILKKSAKYVWKFKFLWLLGILTASGSFFSGGNYSTNSIPGDLKQLNNLGDSTARSIFETASAEVSSVGKVLGDSIGPSAFESLWVWVIMVVFVLIIVLLFIYLNVTAKSAIVWAIDSIDDKKSPTLKMSWKVGHRLFWRRFSLDIIYVLIMVLPLMVLSIPVVVVAIFNLTALAIVFGILFGIIYAVYAIYLAILIPYSERYLVLENHRALASINEARGLFTKKWGEILLMYVILYVVAMILVLALLLTFVVAAVPLFVIGIGLSYIHALVLAIYAVIMGIVLFLVFIIASGMINAFSSAVLTLTYKELVKK